MQVDFVIPFLIGIATVMQATLNKEIASHVGLAAATALNMTIAALCAFAFAAWCATRGDANGFTKWAPDLAAFRAWWLLPGLVGFAIVIGLPWSVQRIGALSTFVVLVAAQMIASALWDRFAAGIPLTPSRLAGASCTIVGVILLSRSPTP